MKLFKKLEEIAKFFIEYWYVGLLESGLVSALWQYYPTITDPLAKKTFILSIILVFYLPGYLGLYGLYKKLFE